MIWLWFSLTNNFGFLTGSITSSSSCSTRSAYLISTVLNRFKGTRLKEFTECNVSSSKVSGNARYQYLILISRLYWNPV